MNPITEMGRYIAGSINLARAKRQFAELLGWEAAQDIHADVVAHQQKVVAVAHKAEVYDREALTAWDRAAAPDSDGGANITPAEQQQIRRLVAKSAELDHDASELAGV